MNILKMNCTACGAPISIPEDVLQITCTSCGTSLLVERGEGYVALKVAEKLARAIESSSAQTQEVIRENTQVTRTELQRLQLSQELSAAEMQLNGIQSEIRMLERETRNSTAAKQLLTLRQNEYTTMERIRALKLQIDEPSPDDLNASLALAEWEQAWVGKEMAALKGSAHPQRVSLLTNLADRQNRLNAAIVELKARRLKKQYASFQLADPPAEDAEKLSALLQILNRDEQESSREMTTPEGKFVHAEIQRRVKQIQEVLHRLDLERISRTLTSLKGQPDPHDPASLQAHLAQLDQDLQSLLNTEQSGTAQEIQQKILAERKNTLARLQALERGRQSFDDAPFVEPAIRTTQRAGFAQVGLGCLVWALILTGFFVIGFVIYGLITDSDAAAIDLGMAVTFLFLLVGLIVGGWNFLRQTGPTITIRGFAGRRNLVITPRHPEKAIRSEKIVKFLVGLIAWISVYIIFLMLIGCFAGGKEGLTVFLFFLGLVLGPVAARFVARRTTIALAE